MDNIQLIFEPEALKATLDRVFEQKNGARGLRSIMESILSEAMFTAPSDGTIETADHYGGLRQRKRGSARHL